MTHTLDDIPGPKGVPVLGNMFEIKQATMMQDLMKLGREWGPIFVLKTPTGPRYIVYGLEMVDDLCDDSRFDKLVGVSQRELRQTHENQAIRVTLIEPGMVDTPFFDDGAADWALQPDDIARAAMFALEQPERVDVNEILIRPSAQPI